MEVFMPISSITDAMNSLTHGVYVLGVHTSEQDNLMTAAWLCQVSSSPAMLAVAVSNGHLTADLIQRAGAFTVSVLNSNQKDIALKCGTVSGRKADKTTLVNIDRNGSGIPVIHGSIAQMECRVVDTNTITGNHTIFIAQVTDAAFDGTETTPLIYHVKEFF